MAMHKTAAPSFRRGRASLWTRDKIEPLSTIEIRQLLANAQRLGETEIAVLCDEVLGARPRGRAVERKPARKRAARGLVTRNAALGSRGVTPKSRTWSRSGVREADGRVVMTLWADDVRGINPEAGCLLWAPNLEGARPWSDSPGGKERLEHCVLAMGHGEAEALLAYGERMEGFLPEQKVLHLDGVDADNVLAIRIEKRGEEYWAVWDGAAQGREPLPVQRASQVPNPELDAVS